MQLKEWVEKNKILTFILFWGGLILISYLLSGLHKTDREKSPLKLCAGQKDYKECIQRIEQYYEQQNEFMEDQKNNQYRPY